MITTTQTLLSLACLIANKGEMDTSSIEAQLNDNDKIMIQSVIESESCLPKNLEQLLRKTDKSGLREKMMRSSSSEACFA